MSQTTALLDKEIVPALNHYVEIQENLIVEFQKQYHPLSSDLDLLKQPKTGILSAVGEEWKFQKHGTGIVFESNRSGKIIDAHKGIIDRSKAFDSWRLAEYFESSSCSKVVWESNTYSADDEEDLDKLLELLSQANIIKLVATQYRLYELNQKLN